MPFDYKKEFSEFYLPAKKPSIIKIPAMNFVAVSGKGNPNEEGGEYVRSRHALLKALTRPFLGFVLNPK